MKLNPKQYDELAGSIKKAIKHPPSPPDHLSETTKQLWRSIVPRRALSPERLALLRTALEALDRADQAREALLQEGLVFTTAKTGTKHVNPIVRIEKDARQQFLHAWSQLRLSSYFPMDEAEIDVEVENQIYGL